MIDLKVLGPLAKKFTRTEELVDSRIRMTTFAVSDHPEEKFVCAQCSATLTDLHKRALGDIKEAPTVLQCYTRERDGKQLTQVTFLTLILAELAECVLSCGPESAGEADCGFAGVFGLLTEEHKTMRQFVSAAKREDKRRAQTYKELEQTYSQVRRLASGLYDALPADWIKMAEMVHAVPDGVSSVSQIDLSKAYNDVAGLVKSAMKSFPADAAVERRRYFENMNDILMDATEQLYVEVVSDPDDEFIKMVTPSLERLAAFWRGYKEPTQEDKSDG